MLEDYTYMAKQSVVAAQEAAREMGHESVGTEHLLLGLFVQGGNPSAKALKDLGVTHDVIAGAVTDVLGEAEPGLTAPPFDVEARATLDAATEEATALNSERVGAEHLLLALVRDRESGAVIILEKIGVDPEGVRPSVMKLLMDAPVASAPSGAGAGKELGQILVDQGAISAGDLDGALEGAREKLIGRALIDLGLISEADLVGALAVQIGLEFVHLDTYPIEPWAVQLIPAAAAWRHHILPIGERDGALLVAMSNPADQHALDDVRVMTSRQVTPMVAMASDIERALRTHLGSREDADAREELPVTSGKWADAVGVSGADDWRGPSDQVIGTPVDLSPVLALTNTGVFVAVTDVVVYPQGMRIVVTLRRKAAPRSDKWFEAVSWQHRWQGAGIPELSPRSLRVGVEFPDGSRVDNLSFRELPSRRPPGPTLLSLGADGSPWRVDVQYWVWPLPREGTAAFFCEWPSEGVPLSRAEFDCSLLTEAADKAHTLWDLS